MATEYKYEGETFQLDDSKGCYVEVTYRDQIGYLGVNLEGTKGTPFVWYSNRPDVVTPDGMKFGNSNGPDEATNLKALCADLLRLQRQAEAREAFNPEEACKSLHEYVESLPR